LEWAPSRKLGKSIGEDLHNSEKTRVSKIEEVQPEALKVDDDLHQTQKKLPYVNLL
jgi:hypothetical protein